MPRTGTRPLVGITSDLAEHPNGLRVFTYRGYAGAVAAAGGTPVQLVPDASLVEPYLHALDAIVLTGGDDPRTEPFGQPTHHAAVPVHPDRQAFETALLRALADARPAVPVLGVCLGMQMMALCAGGRLDQHMPETIGDRADVHWDADHSVEPTGTPPPGVTELRGRVRSRHHQAVRDPGDLAVIAAAPDGVIEAVAAPDRRFYLGVQWHPERTADRNLGPRLFELLVHAAGAGVERS